jgi:hypothetical protein
MLLMHTKINLMKEVMKMQTDALPHVMAKPKLFEIVVTYRKEVTYQLEGKNDTHAKRKAIATMRNDSLIFGEDEDSFSCVATEISKATEGVSNEDR